MNKPHITCLSIDCPERKSLCCDVWCTNGEKGEPRFVCSKCRKEFVGGPCDAEKFMTTPDTTKETGYQKNIKSHDVQMSPMAPSFCRRCNKSGNELGAEPCHTPPVAPVEDWVKEFDRVFPPDGSVAISVTLPSPDKLVIMALDKLNRMAGYRHELKSFIRTLKSKWEAEARVDGERKALIYVVRHIKEFATTELLDDDLKNKVVEALLGNYERRLKSLGNT